MAFKMKYSGGGFPYKSSFKQNDDVVEEVKKANELADETEFVADPDDFMANIPDQPGPTVENEPSIIEEDITKYNKDGEAILNEPVQDKMKTEKYKNK